MSISTESELLGMQKVSEAVASTLKEMIKYARIGMTTRELDLFGAKILADYGAKSAPYLTYNFPGYTCISVNNEICHGIPSEKVVLKDGDIINVDCTTIVHKHFADASRMFCIGHVSEEAKRLVEVTKECLEIGKEAVRPWGYIGDIGAAIQEHAHKNGYSVVVDFCGHGVGNAFHEDPYVHHVGIRNTGMVIAPGMVFTIEPMINQGTRDLYIDKDNGWTSYTKDGKLSAQWENTILVTEKGIEVLAW